MEPIKVACIHDSPKVHTGFGTVAAPLCLGLHEAGMEVHAYGLLDHEADNSGELPYHFYPVPRMDDLGHATYGFFLRKVKPDVVFILTDPGNIHSYTDGIIEDKAADYKKDGYMFRPPVVVYTPIEGSPSPEAHGQALYDVEMLGGKIIVYCQAAKKAITSQFEVSPDVMLHGLDHAPFRKYNESDRKILRELAGIDDYFVCGNIGVNKRTKGHPTLIYTAKILREWGEDKGILFYCHTNPYRSTMDGYHLKEMTYQHGVADMFVWKQELSGLNYWMGVDRDSGTIEQARLLAGKVPETAQGRGFLWSQYDFISKVNCFDLYVDTSQIEGWGLGAMESMACGVPTLSVHDNHVRDEIHAQGARMMDPLPPRCWDTWHSNMRLVTIDPETVARHIIEMRDNKELRDKYSELGMACAARYKWSDAQQKLVQVINEVVEKDRKLCQEYSLLEPQALSAVG